MDAKNCGFRATEGPFEEPVSLNMCYNVIGTKWKRRARVDVSSPRARSREDSGKHLCSLVVVQIPSPRAGLGQSKSPPEIKMINKK